MQSSENKLVLSKLQRDIDDFNHTYMLVAGFEQLAVERVRTICNRTLEVSLFRFSLFVLEINMNKQNCLFVFLAIGMCESRFSKTLHG